MRSLLIAGLAVVSLTGIAQAQERPDLQEVRERVAEALEVALAAQNPAPTVTPMPLRAGRVFSVRLTIPYTETRARLEEAAAALRATQAAAPITEQTVQNQTSPLAGVNACTLPDKASHPINAKVTFNGWSYLCVEVLDDQLARRGAGWIRVAD